MRRARHLNNHKILFLTKCELSLKITLPIQSLEFSFLLNLSNRETKISYKMKPKTVGRKQPSCKKILFILEKLSQRHHHHRRFFYGEEIKYVCSF